MGILLIADHARLQDSDNNDEIDEATMREASSSGMLDRIIHKQITFVLWHLDKRCS